MQNKQLYFLIIISSFLFSCENQDRAQTNKTLVFTNGKIYTVNENQPWASAIVVKEGKIIYVGSDQEALNFKDSQTKAFDLNGKMMLPGFHDIHVHPVHGGVTFLQCNLSDIQGIDNLLSKIKVCANKNDSEWVLGGGWSVDNFSASMLPDKKLLDKIIPNRLFFLYIN